MEFGLSRLQCDVVDRDLPFFPTEEASPMHFQCSPLSLFAPMATKMSSTSPADATPPDAKVMFTCTVSSAVAVPKIWRASLSP